MADTWQQRFREDEERISNGQKPIGWSDADDHEQMKKNN